MTRMPVFVLALSVALMPATALAQESQAPDGEVDEGINLIEEGAKLLLRGLTNEIEPLMDDLAEEMEPKLRAFAKDFMPLMEDFSDLIGDLDMYHPPERLPNGDIILRRKTPPEVEVPEGEDVEI